MKKIIKVNLARPYPKTHWPCESCWGDSPRPRQFEEYEPDFQIVLTIPAHSPKRYTRTLVPRYVSGERVA